MNECLNRLLGVRQMVNSKQICIYHDDADDDSVGHKVKDSEREIDENCCRRSIGHYFSLASRDILYTPFHREDSTCHILCSPAVGWNLK